MIRVGLFEISTPEPKIDLAGWRHVWISSLEMIVKYTLEAGVEHCLETTMNLLLGIICGLTCWQLACSYDLEEYLACLNETVEPHLKASVGSMFGV